jgi:ATPase subunit of ABC transporter with duplicated ATPase domains
MTIEESASDYIPDTIEECQEIILDLDDGIAGIQTQMELYHSGIDNYHDEAWVIRARTAHRYKCAYRRRLKHKVSEIIRRDAEEKQRQKEARRLEAERAADARKRNGGKVANLQASCSAYRAMMRFACEEIRKHLDDDAFEQFYAEMQESGNEARHQHFSSRVDGGEDELAAA